MKEREFPGALSLGVLGDILGGTLTIFHLVGLSDFRGVMA